ncbi:mitochondrial biogenesis protein AIM24 [Syncephalis plumigaleata]|nr:mitochondrial biogenesis protein AIM24 [Syncephalis plumigaleata]
MNECIGAIMMAHLPPHTAVRLSPGIVVGHSPNLTFHRPLYGGLSSAVMGRVMGDPLFMDEYRTNGSSGDLLLAPPRLGDLALLSLDGTIELVARRGAIVAYAGKLTIDYQLRIDRQINRRVSGRGQVVLNAYGGIYRLGLAPGEVYYIEPRRIVAWDLALATITPTLRSKDLTRPTWLSSHYRIVNKALEYLFGAYQFIRRFIGNEKLFRIEGPGDIYLSSRIEPRFPSLRS